MRRFAGIALLCGFFAACGESSTPRPLSVMTQNLYLGADLGPLVSALTPEDLATLSGSVWSDVQASRFAERAKQLASDISRVNPDVLCLQEVSLYRTQSPGDWQSGAPPDATDVALDFLQIMLDALASKGQSYRTVAVADNADEELPVLLDGMHLDVRLTDRDAILVRSDIEAVAGPTFRFPTALQAPIGGAGGTTLTFHRGFVTADVTVVDKTVRVINSHLEVGAANGRIQEQQARELVEAVRPYRGATMLVGDFNSPADGSGTQSYKILTTDSGLPNKYRDTFLYQQGTLVLGQQFASTCCVDLTSQNAIPSSRIDLIMFAAGVGPVDSVVVPPTKTAGGLWPSDHLGFFAKLLLK